MTTIRRLLGFLTPLLGWVALSILLGCAAVASGIGLLGTSASLIARAALHPSIASLQVAIVGVRFFGLSRGVFRYLERLVSHSTNLRLLAGLRSWFYRQIEPLAPAGLVELKSGDLLTRSITDIDTLENFYVRVVAPPVTAGVITLGVGAFASSIDLHSGLALVSGLLVGGVLVPALAYFLSKRTGGQFVAARARMNAALVEGLQGIADITAFSWGDFFLGRVNQLNQALIRAQRRNGLALGTVNALGLLAAQGTLAAVLWLAIPRVVAGQLEGYLLAVLTLIAAASFEAVAQLPLAAQQLESSLQSARRLFEFCSTEEHTSEPPVELELSTRQDSHIELAVHNLSYRYASSAAEALQGIDFVLQPGKKIAVVGPSGSGKSTLASLLLRFLEPQTGGIQVNGRDYQCFSGDQCRRWFAVVSQSTYLFSASVRQNLLLAKPDATEDELRIAIDRAGLVDWLAGLPHGFNTWVGEHGLRLSGGERQRLALARTLLKNAPILLLDEPTANLDALLEEQILKELLEGSGGKSVILITHRLVGLERMDEILVLERGQVIERGKYSDLLAKQGLYARMWQAQRSLICE